MKKKIIKNPYGSKDWLPEEFVKHEFVRKNLVKVFENWGYQPIHTPIIINRETLALGSNKLKDVAFNLIGQNGQILALRADLTTPIARVTAERLQEENFPLRFYYVGKVFRYQARKTTNEKELFQVGIELIGIKEGNADLECLKIFNDAAKKIGLKNYLILLNHTDLWTELFNYFGDTARELYSALSQKNIVLFKKIISDSKFSREEKIFWRELIEIKGGKEALNHLIKISNKIKKINLKKTIIYFKNVFNIFESNVELDLSMTNDLDYYTGVYFELISPYLGRSLGSGGRYDNLISKFGFNTPAIGFSFCLEDLLLSLEKQGKKFPPSVKPTLIPAEKNIKNTFKKIETLQKSNKVAAVKL